LTSPFEPPASSTSSTSGRSTGRDVVVGFLSVCGLHVAACAFGFVVMIVGAQTASEALMIAPSLMMLTIGVWQVLWVLPYVLWARRRQRTGQVQGALIAAVVTFFLNAACYGLMLLLFAQPYMQPLDPSFGPIPGR
jgi:hypothetical protein